MSIQPFLIYGIFRCGGHVIQSVTDDANNRGVSTYNRHVAHFELENNGFESF